MLGKLTLSAGFTTPFRLTDPDSNQLAKTGAVTVQVACASDGSVCALENHDDAITSTQPIDKATKMVSLITLTNWGDLDVVCIEPPLKVSENPGFALSKTIRKA
jgi:hypothetical protein